MSPCTSCRGELPDGALFCRECGTPVASTHCPSCGGLDESGRFCSRCGTALSGTAPRVTPAPLTVRPVAERRVTSVLFGDLVGFTPLSEARDAEEVRELLSRYFEECRTVIGRYGGVVEKFIGDAVMAVWGVPVAHEDDAERAVRAGLDLVATVAAMGQEVGAPGLAMRVGVVTGEVAVTVGATAEGMVAGDAVNTAARVQAAAEPGRVWVEERTRSLAAAAITFEDTGEHELKGKAEPVRLWQAGVVVADVGGGQRVDGLEAPLTGRDSDLRLVRDLFHATQDSLRPRLVVVDGEAGVGKTRLAWEFEKYVDGLAIRTRWHRGRCLSYGDGVAFWALAEAIRARLGLVEADTGEVVTEHLDAGLVEYVAAAGEREWLRPRLAVLLGVGAGPSFAREDLFAAWTAFLEHLSDGDLTVVLVIDDAQHADDGLLDFLDHLLGTARSPIFVLALARPDLLVRRPDLGGRRTTVVRLEPLGDEAMADLVDGLVVGLPDASRSALVARAEGIPLFAVETVRALIDRDLVIPREGRYVPAEGADLDLDAVGAPASLQALVAARLDALTGEEKRVVTDASVLGVSFTREGLVALGSDPETVDAVLGSLTRKEILSLLTDRFTAERGQYRFVQSVVRQVAYGTQSKRDRKSRHVAAADYLADEPDPADDLAVLIAQHLLDAADAAPAGDTDVPELTARAGAYLERGAVRARAVGAPGEALRLLELALTHTEDPGDLARLHLAAARAAQDAARFTLALEHGRSATAEFDGRGEATLAGQAAAVHATALVYLGDLEAAIEVAKPRWRALDQLSGAEPAVLDLTRVLGRAYSGLGDYDAQAAFAERMLLVAEGLSDANAVALALLRAGTRYSAIGAPITARLSYEGVASLAREHDLTEPLSNALTNLSAHLNSRDLPAAQRYAQQAIELARRSGVQGDIDISVLNLIIGTWTAGRVAEAAAIVADAAETVTDPGIRHCLDTVEVWLAEARGEAIPGRDPDDGDTADQSTLAWRSAADIARARADGDPKGAAAIAAGAITHLIAASDIDDDFMVLWPPMVLAALAAQDLELAEGLLEPVESARPGRVSPAVAGQWHRLRGLVAAARGDAADAVEAELRTGIALLGDFGATGYRAQAQEELARWLVEQRRPEDAQPLVDAVRATYSDIGAPGWLSALEDWHSTGRSPQGPSLAVIQGAVGT